MRVRWRRNAQLDLIEIDTYIRQDSPQAASRVIAAIRRKVDQLSKTPLMGKPGRLNKTRELVVSKLPYIVAYEITSSAIEILAVVHTARLWPEDFS